MPANVYVASAGTFLWWGGKSNGREGFVMQMDCILEQMFPSACVGEKQAKPTNQNTLKKNPTKIKNSNP